MITKFPSHSHFGYIHVECVYTTKAITHDFSDLPWDYWRWELSLKLWQPFKMCLHTVYMSMPCLILMQFLENFFFQFNFTKTHGFSSLKHRVFCLDMCLIWTVLPPVWGNTYLASKYSFRSWFFLGYFSRVTWFLIGKVTFIHVSVATDTTKYLSLCWTLKVTRSP